MSSSLPALRRCLLAVTAGFALASPASAQTPVTDSSSYVDALTTINDAATGSTGNSYTLDLAPSVTVTPGTGNTVTVNGNGGALDGGGTLTPVVIYSGTVTLNDLTIQNGLGGGLFIATSAVVTLHNVSVTNNAVRGGLNGTYNAQTEYNGDSSSYHGGNASFVLGLNNVDANGVPTTGAGAQISGSILGAAGTSAGGQQSLGYLAGAGNYESLGQSGTTGATYDGGGGGGTVLPYDGSQYSSGGGDGQGNTLPSFDYSTRAAGGGGGTVIQNLNYAGGGGGFGAGGGAGAFAAGGGAGAFAAGGGGFGGSGGFDTSGFYASPGYGATRDEGAALGAGIFVMFGAQLTLTGSSTFSGNAYLDAYPGVSATPYLGTDLFMMTGADVTLAPGAGETIHFRGSIGDDSQDFHSAANGTGVLLKLGNSTTPGGTIIFDVANGYGGGTALTHGVTLIVNNAIGSATGTGAVTLAADTTLGGTGRIDGLTTLSGGAHLAPGNSPGTLTFTGGLTLNDGAILDFQLGTASDLIAVSGGTLSGPSSGTITVNLSDSGGFTAGTYTLIDFSTGGTLTDNLDLADFALGTVINGYTYTFVQVGNLIQLTAVAAIPEPAACAALAGALALALTALRRRRTE
ncbi:MAG: hypothetical protein WC661_20975 [Opitutaceae bacterium]|jgi:hypothetical protein